MGLNSYMCTHCQSNIREGEGAILFHVRAGKIIGRSIGWQDGYGKVNRFDDFFKPDDNPNSHNEIMKSRFGLDDSGARSGISALHVPCFRKALKRNPKLLSALLISEGDSNQGFGKSREKYSSLHDVIKLRDDIEAIASTSL
jgi:hypothetical protein